MKQSNIKEKDSNLYEYPAPQLPWSIQMCITYGCNRAPLDKKKYIDEKGNICHKNGCTFCGIHSLIDKDNDTIKFLHMSVDTAKELAKQLNDWVPSRRIEINNFGEPWLNPNWPDIIKALRDYYPSVCIQLQTNGVVSYKDPDKFFDNARKFFLSGGNLLVIDAYEGTHESYLKLSKEFCDKYEEVTPVDYSYNNPKNLSYYSNHGTKAKFIFVVDDLGEMHKVGSARMINNHAGNMNREVWKQFDIQSEDFPLDKKCSRVFREIVVGYDGVISVCCQDFRRQLILGKIPEDNIRDVWNSRAFNTVRKLMYDKNRTTLRPCYECSYAGGFRLGFLSRPEGEVTDDDYKDIIELQEKYSDYIHFNGFAEINGIKIKSTMSK